MTGTPATPELRAELERLLAERMGDSARIASLKRRESDYRTSFPLEELDVRLCDGTQLKLVFKNVARDALDLRAQAVKPAFLSDPLREIEAYEHILAGPDIGTADCYGSSVDTHAGRYWLFLERVSGVELFQVGARATWEHAARWLARMHQTLAPRADRSQRLVRYEPDLLRLWPRRAAEFAAEEARRPLEHIAARYDQIVDRILALPMGVIHGEFYASNVLVDDPDEPARVCAVDWEVAAIGPGLVDVAALVSGRWTDGNRQAIAGAYRSVMPAAARLSSAEFGEALDACRLHLALQWLGWSPDWSPPREHATDWLSEALQLSGRLGL